MNKRIKQGHEKWFTIVDITNIRNNVGYYILYPDGTEGQIDESLTTEKIKEYYSNGCLFGLEK